MSSDTINSVGLWSVELKKTFQIKYVSLYQNFNIVLTRQECLFHVLTIIFVMMRKINERKYKCKEEFEDTKGVIRICKSKDRQHNGPQDTKGVIRICKSKIPKV